MSAHTGQQIHGVVEKLIFGGAGLVRHEGMVIFVPDVIPGERILLEVTNVKARYATGIAVSIDEPSSKRTCPLCPYSTTCGGCQLQHIAPQFHAQFKEQMLQESLHKVLSQGFPVDVVGTDQVWAWRRKITLHGRWKEGQWVVGYMGRNPSTVIPITCCPIFFKKGEEAVLEGLREVMAFLPGNPTANIDLTFFRLTEEAFAVIVSGNVRVSNEVQRKVADGILSLPKVCSITLRFPRLKFNYGPTEGVVEALGRKWHVSTVAFLQNHMGQSEKLWTETLSLVDSGPLRIFDLYSGVGVTAINLALRGHEVTAVELSQSAVKAAKRTAQDIGVRGVRFVCDTVEQFLRSVDKQADLWLVNPPREGLSPEVMKQIVRKKPRLLLYISCSAPTLARDLQVLVKEGWRLVHVRGYDMFPQTTHFETLAFITRT